MNGPRVSTPALNASGCSPLYDIIEVTEPRRHREPDFATFKHPSSATIPCCRFAGAIRVSTDSYQPPPDLRRQNQRDNPAVLTAAHPGNRGSCISDRVASITSVTM